MAAYAVRGVCPGVRDCVWTRARDQWSPGLWSTVDEQFEPAAAARAKRCEMAVTRAAMVLLLAGSAAAKTRGVDMSPSAPAAQLSPIPLQMHPSNAPKLPQLRRRE